MVVVSDTGWDIRPVLDKHGLLEYFAGLVLSYEHGAAKPAPQLFAAACEQLGVDAADALMVGDNALTDGGAIESGVRVYLLPAGSTSPDPRARRGAATRRRHSSLSQSRVSTISRTRPRTRPRTRRRPRGGRS